MNYIIHLNAFFTKAEEDHLLTPYHQSLYLTLFRMWNQSRFKQVIKISRETTMIKAKIGSPHTYYKCLKELAEAGYIHYYPSKLRHEAATVTIIPFLHTEQPNTSVSEKVPSGCISDTTVDADMHPAHNTSDTCVVANMHLTGCTSDTTVDADVHPFHKQHSKKFINNNVNGTIAINNSSNSNNTSFNSTNDVIRSLYDYKDTLRQLQQKGQELFGSHFRLLKEDLPVIVPILSWMLRDEEVAAQYQIDLKKGIFLAGPIGSGKTQLMQLMRYLITGNHDYNVYSCPKISLEYSQGGVNALQPYTYDRLKTKENPPVSCCFDDLGKELNMKHYGSYCDVMQHIMRSRHELLIHTGIITHATSSLNTLALEKRYGKEIRSKFREMFNRIGFPNTTPDKRKNHLL